MPSDMLNAHAIKEEVKHPAIQQIHVFEQLDSTNTWALQHAQCGDVCLAEQQTAGRGRRGRNWHSPQQGNLYLSLKWCFAQPSKHFGLLSLLVAISLAECLQELGLKGHGVKWPNDILYQNKKLGGILLETKGNLNEVVIGIGLNIAMQQSTQINQAWTSLNQCLKQTVNRNQLISQLLNRLAENLSTFPQLDLPAFKQQWQSWNLLENQTISITYQKQILHGKMIDITADGMLEVELDNGNRQVFSAVDVSVRV